eukprot:COSAG02_NODE_48549_length_333_cov_0.611111_2_plen_43_part_01
MTATTLAVEQLVMFGLQLVASGGLSVAGGVPAWTAVAFNSTGS